MDLTSKDKNLLLWASFLSLLAAGVGFVFRSMVPALWGSEFNITDSQVGALFGAGLWPIAIMMILFSFIIDKVGYKFSMIMAFLLQAVSVVLTFTANSYDTMWWACIIAGLGHGVVEAAINPMCISAFREGKTKAMNILHAAWPAGIVIGGSVYNLFYIDAGTWAEARSAWIFMLLPVLAYGVMFFLVKKFPIDERVENNVPMSEMFKEFGGLGAFLAVTFIGYEIFTQQGAFSEGQYDRLLTSLAVGAVGGAIFGFICKSKGKFMFFFLCLIMIPLATAEIATDGWIRNLMAPSLGKYSGWALVFSAFIMMILRFAAGIPLRYMGPLGLLLLSSCFSIIGLFALSYASGAAIIVAFIFYAVGQTYYWPSILGFTAERFPKGGALTLNTVSAMGLLTVGIFGFPFLGAVQDNYNAKAVIEAAPAVVEAAKAEGRTIKDTDVPIVTDKNLFGVTYTTVNSDAIMAQPEFPQAKEEELNEALKNTGRSTLRIAAILPVVMAIGFVLMLLWFRANGGYRAIDLSKGEG